MQWVVMLAWSLLIVLHWRERQLCSSSKLLHSYRQLFSWQTLWVSCNSLTDISASSGVSLSSMVILCFFFLLFFAHMEQFKRERSQEADEFPSYSKRALLSNTNPFFWSSRDTRFAGSYPAVVNGFFQDVKIPENYSSGRHFKPWVPSLEISGSLKNL